MKKSKFLFLTIVLLLGSDIQSNVTLVWRMNFSKEYNVNSSNNPPVAAAYNHKDNVFAAARGDGFVYIFNFKNNDLAHAKLIRRLNAKGNSKYLSVHSLAFSPDGHFIAVACFDEIQIWDWKKATLIAELAVSSVESVRFSSDGKQVIAIIKDAEVLVWAQEGEKTWSFKHLERFGSSVYATAADQKWLFVITYEGVVTVFENKSVGNSTDWIYSANFALLKKYGEFFFAGPGYSIACCQKGFVAVGTKDSIVLFKEDVNGSWPFVQELTEHKSKICQLAFNSAGDVLASCSTDGTITVYVLNEQLKTWKLVQTIKNAHTGLIRSVLFCGCGGDLLMTAAKDGLKVWAGPEISRYVIPLGFLGK